MTDKEKAIRWFENIAYECDKLTSGNVAHLKAQIKGMAIRSAEYLTKHSQEPVSEDLEQEMDRYFETMQVLEHEYIFEDTFQRIAKHFTEWQKERDQKELQIAEEHGILTGMNMEREQMMKDAAEGQFDYNHIIVPYSELARVFPNGKDGDKVKVIIIKD